MGDNQTLCESLVVLAATKLTDPEDVATIKAAIQAIIAPAAFGPLIVWGPDYVGQRVDGEWTLMARNKHGWVPTTFGQMHDDLSAKLEGLSRAVELGRALGRQPPCPDCGWVTSHDRECINAKVIP